MLNCSCLHELVFRAQCNKHASFPSRALCLSDSWCSFPTHSISLQPSVFCLFQPSNRTLSMPNLNSCSLDVLRLSFDACSVELHVRVISKEKTLLIYSFLLRLPLFLCLCHPSQVLHGQERLSLVRVCCAAHEPSCLYGDWLINTHAMACLDLLHIQPFSIHDQLPHSHTRLHIWGHAHVWHYCALVGIAPLPFCIECVPQILFSIHVVSIHVVTLLNQLQPVSLQDDTRRFPGRVCICLINLYLIQHPSPHLLTAVPVLRLFKVHASLAVTIAALLVSIFHICLCCHSPHGFCKGKYLPSFIPRTPSDSMDHWVQCSSHVSRDTVPDAFVPLCALPMIALPIGAKHLSTLLYADWSKTPFFPPFSASRDSCSRTSHSLYFACRTNSDPSISNTSSIQNRSATWLLALVSEWTLLVSRILCICSYKIVVSLSPASCVLFLTVAFMYSELNNVPTESPCRTALCARPEDHMQSALTRNVVINSPLTHHLLLLLTLSLPPMHMQRPTKACLQATLHPHMLNLSPPRLHLRFTRGSILFPSHRTQ